MGHAATIQRLFESVEARTDEDGRELFDPEIEWLEPPETIGRNVVTGPDAALAALENWNEQFDSLRAETTELREEGDRVLHAMRQFARARGSDGRDRRRALHGLVVPRRQGRADGDVQHARAGRGGLRPLELLVAAQDPARDRHPVDLVGAVVDARVARVPVHPLERRVA